MRQAREGWDALLVVTVLFLRKRATTGKQAKLISADEMVLHNRNSMSKRERKLPVACNGVGDVHYLAISSRCAIVDVGEKSECNYTEGCMGVGHWQCGEAGVLLSIGVEQASLKLCSQRQRGKSWPGWDFGCGSHRL